MVSVAITQAFRNEVTGFARHSRSLPGNSRRRRETVAHCAGVNEWIGANLM